jgi:hypothetical protein
VEPGIPGRRRHLGYRMRMVVVEVVQAVQAQLYYGKFAVAVDSVVQYCDCDRFDGRSYGYCYFDDDGDDDVNCD